MRLTEKQAREMGLAVPPRPKGQKPRGMNRTEEKYAAYLDELKQAGLIKWYVFEAIKLRLAEKTWYTPDFAVMEVFKGHAYGDNDSVPIVEHYLAFHEVKGFWRDDARVKIKVAAELFPFTFKAVRYVGGRWDIEVIPGKRDHT